MKKLLIFLVLVIIVVAGVYLYRKRNRLMQQNPNLPGNAVLPTEMPSTTTPSTGTDMTNPGQQQISLTITAPQNNSTVTTASVQVAGKTVPNADVSVNDQDLKADAQGNFTATVGLDWGDNMIDVVANDAQGNSAEQEITVTFNAPQ